MGQSNCKCGYLYVGMTKTNARNLNADCPEHGIGTEYFKKQIEKWKKDE